MTNSFYQEPDRIRTTNKYRGLNRIKKLFSETYSNARYPFLINAPFPGPDDNLLAAQRTQ